MLTALSKYVYGLHFLTDFLSHCWQLSSSVHRRQPTAQDSQVLLRMNSRDPHLVEHVPYFVRMGLLALHVKQAFLVRQVLHMVGQRAQLLEPVRYCPSLQPLQLPSGNSLVPGLHFKHLAELVQTSQFCPHYLHSFTNLSKYYPSSQDFTFLGSHLLHFSTPVQTRQPSAHFSQVLLVEANYL